MSTFGTTSISQSAVKVALGEPSANLRQLTSSVNMNKYAYYSPNTRNGRHMPFTCTAVSSPFDCKAWTYNPWPNTTSCKLGDFRQYTTSSPTPISSNFPLKLYVDVTNTITISIANTDSYSIAAGSVINYSNLYFGFGIRKKGDNSTLMWGTSSAKGGTSVSFNISSYQYYFPANSVVEVIVFYSSVYKLFGPSSTSTSIFSVKCDNTVVDRKEYTLEYNTPPTDYETLTLGRTPTNGNWSDNDVWFNELSITVKSRINTMYRYGLRICTQDNYYKNDFRMASPVQVNAGVTKTILVSYNMSLFFYPARYTSAYVQIIDILDGDKVLVQYPIVRR